METREILAIIFGLVALVGIINGTFNRFQLRRSIGAVHIQYPAVAVGLPMAGSLAFLGLLTEAAVAVITSALAYAFAGVAGGER